MTTIGIKVDGLHALLKQLHDVGDAGKDIITETIYDIGFETKENAIAGISGGPKSGVTYNRIYDAESGTMRIYAGSYSQYGPNKLVAVFKTGGAGNLSAFHTSSAPGQYPASDTGVLASSIALQITDGGRVATVGTHIKYGKWLELGTSKILPRPFLLPSFERAKIGVEKELRARLEAKI